MIKRTKLSLPKITKDQHVKVDVQCLNSDGGISPIAGKPAWKVTKGKAKIRLVGDALYISDYKDGDQILFMADVDLGGAVDVPEPMKQKLVIRVAPRKTKRKKTK